MNNNYLKWLNEPTLDKELHDELNAMSDAQIEEAFYKHVSFGTGGMRGIVGAGTNRMNIYTVRKAAYGFAKHLLEHYESAASRGVAIAYDNRNKSDIFAKECVGVLSSFGIKTYLFENIRPTPLLSYAVRSTNAAGGIMVTASHNPPMYNGVKMYDDTGCQLVPKLANRVIDHVDQVKDLFTLKSLPFEEAKNLGLVEILGRAMDSEYIKRVHEVQLNKTDKKTIKCVFTPLHGTSREIGLRSLVEAGYTVLPVEEQMVADPKFSTVKSPNPEDSKAFALAEKLGLKEKAELLIATDPDGDRLGVAVYHEGRYVYLTGNQTGAIFIHYLLSERKKNGTLPSKGIVYNTIVTNDFGAEIAKSYGMDVVSTLTGFKFIGEKLLDIENTDTEFIMGYEESYGYVIKDFVRDKDATQAMVLAAEIANVLAKEGKTMVDYLETLYSEYGAYRDGMLTLTLEGKQGEEQINAIMSHFRSLEMATIDAYTVLAKEDYLHGIRTVNGETETLDFPESNVLKFVLKEGWFVLRPSGTEPKLKVYLALKGNTKQEADTAIETLKSTLMGMIEPLINNQ